MESLDARDAFAFLDFVGDLSEHDDPLGTRFLPRTSTVLHVFELPSAEAFDEAGRRAALPFERIVEVVDGSSSPKEDT